MARRVYKDLFKLSSLCIANHCVNCRHRNPGQSDWRKSSSRKKTITWRVNLREQQVTRTTMARTAPSFHLIRFELDPANNFIGFLLTRNQFVYLACKFLYACVINSIETASKEGKTLLQSSFNSIGVHSLLQAMMCCIALPRPRRQSISQC